MGLVKIGPQGLHIGKAAPIQVCTSGINHSLQHGPGQLVIVHNSSHRIGNRISGYNVLGRVCQHITPPLQADFAQRRFAHQPRNAIQLAVKGEKRHQRIARFRRGKQSGQIAVIVMRPNEA